MDADSETGNDTASEEISSENLYGELNALLNEITAGGTDTSVTDPANKSHEVIDKIDTSHDKSISHEVEAFKDDKILDKVDENTEEKLQNVSGDISKDSDAELIDEVPINLVENVEKDETNKSMEESSKDPEICSVEDAPSEIPSPLGEDKELEQLKDNLDKPKDTNDGSSTTEEPSIEKDSKIIDENTAEDHSSESQESIEESAMDCVATENLIEPSTDTLTDTVLEQEKMDISESTSEEQESALTVNENILQTPSKDDKTQKTSTSVDNDQGTDQGESNTRRRSNSPEELINLLKKLSPEKLKEIRSKIFTEAQDSAVVNEEEKMETDEAPMATSSKEVADVQASETSAEAAAAKIVEDDDDDCVILLDSDDDEPPSTTAEAPKQLKSVTTSVQTKRKSSNDKTNKPKTFKRTKECVNLECPRLATDDFIECPQLILSFYYVLTKASKVQYVCSSCSDKAILKYEELGEALLNNKPLFNVSLQKKQDMVEVIDSDEEDDKPTEKPIVPDLEKILWNNEVELQVERILQDVCNRVDMKSQLKWDNNDISKREDKLEKIQCEFDDDLKILEQKSSKMYSELYSINKPRIQRRQSLNITHEIEAKPIEAPPAVIRILPKPATSPVQAKRPSITPLQAPRQIIRVSQPINPATVSATQPINRPGPASQKFVITQAAPRIVVPAVSTSGHPMGKLPDTPRSMVHFAVRLNVPGKMQNWVPCKVLELIKTPENTKKYRVQFFDALPNNNTIVIGKELALSTINTKLTIGARVIAQFPRSSNKGIKDNSKKYMPGVIGEKLSKYNNQRYLVFCDYGQVQYISADCVREIAEVSPNVWEDVHENLKQFIFDYLQSQTQRQRALLNIRKQQRVPTERNGGWKNATVIDIDCSVVKMFFPDENVSEWLYRGSKRLGPLYSQGQRSANANARRNDPNICYITIDDDYEQNAEQDSSDITKKNTAKKSTAPPPPVTHLQKQLQQQLQQQAAHTSATSGPQQKVVILNDKQIYLDEPKKVTKHRHFTPRKDIAAKRYVEHNCSPNCLPKVNNNLANYSPLTKPLLTCWERQILRQKANRWIIYKAPCGRRLRNMYEIRKFLMITKCFLNVDNFDFDVHMQVLNAYDVLDKAACPLYIADMSEGKEGMKIPIINAFDDQRPPKLEYSAARIPMPGVNINTDPEFMACCDCTDDCADKSKCACFQLTIRGYKYSSQIEDDIPDEDVSYVWKRLLQPVATGIYECHSRCGCTSRCLNKVVQQPIQIKMHLFRTPNRGWGLECCHDIPKGTFICIYAGRLHREEDANALCEGQNHGDEYFAELDLIETATPLKEGYEASAIMESDSDEEKLSDSDSDYDARKDHEDGDFMTTSKATGNREILTRSARQTKTRSKDTSEKDDNESDSDSDFINMQPSNNPNAPKTKSLRKFFGKNEKPYVMDAKNCGNVGRYFNHSCDPNLFVQSVFVDTHDMRFPWIAFFAARAIKAGDELTWNYNYEVNSVNGKVLYCKCGTKNCRGRIL